jgi:type IV pilus assembly protein PilB
MNSPTERGVVMAVDDDQDMLQWLKAILEGSGFEFVGLDRGAGVVEAVAARRPKVVLMDLHLPDVSGLEVCEQLQDGKETQLVPVIFLTATAGELERAKALRAGAVDFLVKPLAPAVLVAKVEACLQTHEVWDALSTNRQDRPSAVEAPMQERWNGRFGPGAFAKFKQGLVAAGANQRLASIGAGDLYEGAARFGMQARSVTEAMAAFLGLGMRSDVQGLDVRLGVLPTPFCRSHHIVPLSDANKAPRFLLSNPFHLEVLDALERACPAGSSPELILAEPSIVDLILAPKGAGTVRRRTDINTLEIKLKEEYDSVPLQSVSAEHVHEESAPIIQMVNSLLEEAHVRGASDIHIEPTEDEVVVRYRVDGDLQIVHRFKPARLAHPLVARLKIMAQLDITEKRLPQDGRISFRKHAQGGRDFDLRVAIMPVQHGEKCVLRILDRSKAVLPLPELGFSKRNLDAYRERIRSPYGMILHVGPTGSGKSMSLYAALNEMKNPTINIQTVEDPIEYTLAGISQTQVNAEIGLTFQRALRSFLRLDPDVILVGEIRDRETAHVAVEAALTGHVVFSTLHTNDASSTVLRLTEMGIEPYLVSSSLLAICAQRLVRRLCTACRVAYVPDPLQAEFVGSPPGRATTLYRAGGCDKCGGTGYRGRVGVHELLVMDDRLRTEINRRGCTVESLKELAVRECGMTTLFWDAMEKVRDGTTTVEDVLVNVRPDDFESRPAWMRPG